MTDRELKEIREKISCPQLGDTHYGEWGILTPNQRFTIKRMLDLIESQEQYIRTLTANGVIVPLCDIGQTVYTRYGYSFKIQRIEILEDKKVIFRCGNDGTDDYMAFYDFEIGTDVFLTKEEAEQALKEKENG